MRELLDVCTRCESPLDEGGCGWNCYERGVLAARIGNWMELRGFGLRQLARATGITPSHVCKLRSGATRNPTLSVIHRLCRALRCTPNDLTLNAELN